MEVLGRHAYIYHIHILKAAPKGQSRLHKAAAVAFCALLRGLSEQGPHLNLALVFAEGEEVVLLLPLYAALLVRGAHVVPLHLAVVLVGLAAHTIPPCRTANESSAVSLHHAT